MSSRLYQFSGTALGAIEWCDSSHQKTLVADSWRVDDGSAVGLDRHRSRFTNSATALGVDSAVVSSFWAAVIEAVPREGSWFPRVEVVHTAGGPTLRYRERVAPDWLDTVALAAGATDPRTTPLTKGPDLEALMALRRSVADVGATEALIVSPEGHVIEGAYSTVMVWMKGSDALSVVGPAWPRIPSVTESVLLDVARIRGIEVTARTLSLESLEGAEIWILSALHGIRVATEFHNGPEIVQLPGRRDDWHRAWWDLRTPLASQEIQSPAPRLTD